MVAFTKSDTDVTTWMGADIVNSTSNTRDENGVTAQQRYTPFGEVRIDGNLATDHTYTGQVNDETTGLAFYNARYYDPATARFITPDSIVPNPNDGQDYNRYSYVRNNPVRFGDPSGNMPCEYCNDRQAAEHQQVLASGRANSAPAAYDSYSYSTPETITVAEAQSRIEAQSNGGFTYDFGFQVASDIGDTVSGTYNAVTSPIDSGSNLIGCVSSPIDCGGSVFNDFVEPCRQSLDGSCAGRAATTAVGSGFLRNVIKRLNGPRVGPCPRSFSADTGVLMADGTTKPMSEIEVGDSVWAVEPETGEEGERIVTAVWPHDDILVDFTVDGGSVTTTEDHHFWNVTDNEWQETRHIDQGDHLLTAEGHTVEAGNLDWTTAHHADAYDLTVDGLHTYFVSAGTDQVLVHNCDGIHGVFRGATRDVDIDEVVANGRIFVQPDGRHVFVAPNSATTNSAVILSGPLATDSLVSVRDNVTDAALEARIADGRWIPLEDR